MNVLQISEEFILI